MRVAITNPFAWPHVRRGSETLALGLASWLRGHGIDARIAAGGPRPRRYEVDGVPVATVAAPDLRRVHHDLDPMLTLVPALTAHLARSRDDVVHALLYPDALAARAARRPYIVHYGGIALRRGFDAHPLRWRAFVAATAGARAVVSPSEAAAAHLRSEFGVEARVIYNAIHCDRFRPKVATVPGRILCAATPDDSRKRVDVLVGAFARVAEVRSDATLALAGRAGPSTRADLLRRVPPEVARRITFLGDLDQDALADEYARASVSCLAARREAFGLVLIESLAAGTPVVAAREGATPEIVEEGVGMLFEPDDVDACARALLSGLGLADDRATADRCMASARRFDWAAVGPVYAALYEEVA